ncbi:MAG: hypothetical protein ACXU9F_05655, partial [Syntrophales bacterium]
PDGRSTKIFKFENTREGFDTFWGMVMASKNRFKCNEVIAGYESTGPYGCWRRPGRAENGAGGFLGIGERA